VGANLVANRFTYEVTLGWRLDLIKPTQYVGGLISFASTAIFLFTVDISG